MLFKMSVNFSKNNIFFFRREYVFTLIRPQVIIWSNLLCILYILHILQNLFIISKYCIDYLVSKTWLFHHVFILPKSSMKARKIISNMVSLPRFNYSFLSFLFSCHQPPHLVVPPLFPPLFSFFLASYHGFFHKITPDHIGY